MSFWLVFFVFCYGGLWICYLEVCETFLFFVFLPFGRFLKHLCCFKTFYFVFFFVYNIFILPFKNNKNGLEQGAIIKRISFMR